MDDNKTFRDACEAARAYSRRRDSAVKQAVMFGNLNPLRNLFRQNRIPVPDDETILRTAHEMCCHSPEIPESVRKKSAQWLDANSQKGESEL